MKMPKMNVKITAPAMPMDNAVKAGMAKLAQFAHHAPVIQKGREKMERPHGGKGPHNG
jgi:hypothetical protein